jgi:hypothetical protein
VIRVRDRIRVMVKVLVLQPSISRLEIVAPIRVPTL